MSRHRDLTGADPLATTASTIICLAIGLVVAFYSAMAIGVWVPNLLADEHAFRSAPSCTEESVSVPADCVGHQGYVVTGIDLRRKVPKVILTDSTGLSSWVEFDDYAPLLNRLDEGERVVAAVWDGDIREITARGVTQETTAAPLDPPGAYLAAALGTGTAGVLLSVACGWRLRQGGASTGQPPTRRMHYLLRLAAGLGLGGLAVAILTTSHPPRLWVPPALWGLLAVLLVGATGYAWRRAEPPPAPLSPAPTPTPTPSARSSPAPEQA